MTNNRRQKGMTLIEILISLVIGIFLIGGLLQIFVNVQQTNKVQENLSRMQENGRFAMEFLARDLRMAGFWWCVTPVNIENKLNANATFDSFINAIGGQDNNNDGDALTVSDTNADDIVDGTDSIVLKGTVGRGVSLLLQTALNVDNFTIGNNSGLLKNNDVAIISNCTSGDIFQITGITSNTITHNAGSGPGNSSALVEIGPEASPVAVYDSNSKIFKLNFVTYRIEQGAGGRPGLFKSINDGSFEEVVEGVEDMQIIYGEDIDADNTPDYYVPANQVSDMLQVVSVRISLLMSSIDDNLSSVSHSLFYNGSTITPTDKRLRRVFTSTIAVRNRLL